MRRFTVADGMLLATILIWALNVTIVKVLLQHIEPMALTVIRFAITTSVFAVVVGAREGAPVVHRRNLPLLLAAGLCGIWLNQVAFTYGLKNTTAATMTLMLAAVPVFAGIGSWLLGWEHPAWRYWVGILIGFCGVLFVVHGTPQAPGHTANALGAALALLTAASWAGYSLMLRPLMQIYSPFKISLYVAAVGLIGLLPFGIPQLASGAWLHLDLRLWGLILYSTLGSVVLTNLFWYTGIHRLGPARTTMYSYLQPVTGVVFALLILHEPLGVLQVLGGVAIIGGIVFGRTRGKRAVDPGVRRRVEGEGRNAPAASATTRGNGRRPYP